MEMGRPPARMQICLSPGRETENLFGVALSAKFLASKYLDLHIV